MCPDLWKNVMRMIAALIGVMILLVLMIKTTLAGATARKNVISIYTKILMNHFQLIMIAATFNF